MRFTSIFKSTTANTYDAIIVGGGIVGCATARELKLQRPNLRIALMEKESELAFHQTGHNSGVLHAGIYYKPGSLKAKLCVEGIDLAYRYLDEKKIPFKRNGKLVVAVESQQLGPLEELFKRAKQNGCKSIEMVDSKRITEIEPHCRGIQALWSPYTGIVDWALVTRHYAEDFKNAGGEIFLRRPLTSITQMGSKTNPLVEVGTDRPENTLYAKYVITCAGLQSDRVAALSGCSKVPKIVPFRGEYLQLKPEKCYLISTNIYPVPDARFPFLGVHFTPTMNGEVLLGPNAIMAFKREGYNFFDFSPYDFFDAISFRGMQKLILKYAFFGAAELYRGANIRAQIHQLQKYVPELKFSDVIRTGRSGVRAQALDADGNLVDDFVFDDGQGELAQQILHVRNAPSPGATSSLAIAKMVVDKAIEKFKI